MKHCPNCGNPVDDDAVACPSCGFPVPPSDAPASPSNSAPAPSSGAPSSPASASVGTDSAAPNDSPASSDDASPQSGGARKRSNDAPARPNGAPPRPRNASAPSSGAAPRRPDAAPEPPARVDSPDAYDPFPTRQTVDRSTFPVSEERAQDAWEGDETPNYASESSWDQTDAEYDPGSAPADPARDRAPGSDIPIQGMEQTVFENNDRGSEFTKSNYIGLVGFIISVVAACTSWLWGFGWFVWLVGAVVSFVGVFFQPRGWAIAGLCVSLAGIIIIIACCSAFLGAYAAYTMVG